MAHSFYTYLASPIVVGVLLTCQSLDPEYKMATFFQMYFQEKNIILVLYSGQYNILPIYFCQDQYHQRSWQTHPAQLYSLSWVNRTEPNIAGIINAPLSENVSGYVCNHGSPNGERDTASPRGRYGGTPSAWLGLKIHMKKHHLLAGDSPWRHYRRTTI